MVEARRDMKIPTALIPRCPYCGESLTMNLRCDDAFVEDSGWHQAARRYEDFVHRHRGTHLLLLELGVGFNTPGIIKYPFWKMTAQNPQAVYACVNVGPSYCPPQIQQQSLCLHEDLGRVLGDLLAG